MFDDLCSAALKPAYRLNLEETRIQYNQLGSRILIGISVIAGNALLLQPEFTHDLG